MRFLATLVVWLILAVGLSGCETPWFTLTWAPVDFPQPRAYEPSVILAADGSEIGRFAIHHHEAATREELPDLLVNALLAAEDRRFYHHDGIDLRAISRAALANQREGEVVQGGSTITQQLMKNLYLDATDKSLSRKAKEANMAMAYERDHSKDEILTQYCNHVYLGSGAYGVKAGAKQFFRASLADLRVDQIALLIGLLRRPEGASPYHHPEGALAERHRVLVAMRDTAVIDEATFLSADQMPLVVEPPLDTPGAPVGWVADAVRRQITDQGLLGWGEEDTLHQLHANGYRITTTINPAMQAAAQRAVGAYLSGDQPEAAMILLDPTNGHIRAQVGGRRPGENHFDLAVRAQRQGGSVFKAIGLAAALERGISPDQTYSAGSGEFDIGEAQPWKVQSAQGDVPMSLRDGLVVSSNGVYARLGLELGGHAVAQMASTLGVRQAQSTNPANILGGITPGVAPLDMALAFATFANHGVAHDPVLITSITDRHGNEYVIQPPPGGRQVIGTQTADTMTSIMEGVITTGTGKAAAIGRPAAGKTGTVDDYADAWFVGYTPDLVGAVWVGYPDRLATMRHPKVGYIQGGNIPAMIWAQAMRAALAATPPQPFILGPVWATPEPTPIATATPIPEPLVTPPPPGPQDPLVNPQGPSLGPQPDPQGPTNPLPEQGPSGNGANEQAGIPPASRQDSPPGSSPGSPPGSHGTGPGHSNQTVQPVQPVQPGQPAPTDGVLPGPGGQTPPQGQGAGSTLLASPAPA